MNLEEIFARLTSEQRKLVLKRVLELKAEFTVQDKEREKFLKVLEQIDRVDSNSKPRR